MITSVLSVDLGNSGTVSGFLCATNSSLDQVHLADLKTPIGTYPHALVRTHDLVFMEVTLPPVAPPSEVREKPRSQLEEVPTEPTADSQLDKITTEIPVVPQEHLST